MEMSKIVKVIEDLESRLAALRRLVDPEGLSPAPTAGKRGRKKRDPDAPKREPNNWIKFTQRVRGVLKDNDAEIKMAKHFMKFAKHVQANPEGVDITDEEILKSRKSWAPPADGEGSSEEETGASSSAEAGGAAEPAKRGRKPMTDEEKAAAKATREAKKSDHVIAETPSTANVTTAVKKVVKKKE